MAGVFPAPHRRGAVARERARARLELNLVVLRQVVLYYLRQYTPIKHVRPRRDGRVLRLLREVPWRR